MRFKPAQDQEGYQSKLDSVPSDVDVVGFHPKRGRHDRVVVVSCKTWQTGFYADRILAQLRGEAKNPKRPTWLSFRELWSPKWADAFFREVEALTGSDRFTYYLAVTRVLGDTAAWENDPTIQQNLRGNPIRFLPLEQCGRVSSRRSLLHLPRVRWAVLLNFSRQLG